MKMSSSSGGRGGQERVVARTTTHFLPKFDNQNEDQRLAWMIHGAASEVASGILYVSKKHSGSLVMAPPFYSKNGTGNIYSRTGAVVLFEYFQAVWPGEGQKKFQEWWADAERMGICYSFECVTPRILGDHAATPRCAYMVLTCAAVTREDRFMSPSELVQIATKWRLPLNEVWLIPADHADAAEKELHQKRWIMQDADACKVLDKYLPKGQEVQRFLSHAETQGQVLEGFVLMALEADAQQLGNLVKEYNQIMRPFHEAALRSAENLGLMFLHPQQGKEFLKKVEALDIAPLNNPEVFIEPRRSNEEMWDFLCACTEPERMQMVFLRLRRLYGHSVRLQTYHYKSRPQVQVHVLKDEVFYGWPFHMADNSTAPLYRGMVVTLFSEEEAKEFEHQKPAFEKPIPVRILAIAKLKCLNYMWRTFGVRNRLDILMNRGKNDFLKTLQKGFYPPWRIPKEHQATLNNFFGRWADFVHSRSKNEQKTLRGKYLKNLEVFLENNPYPLGTPRREFDEQGNWKGDENGPEDSLMKEVKQISVLFLNLSGAPLQKEQMIRVGINPDSNQVIMPEEEDLVAFYELTAHLPREDRIKEAEVLVVFPPTAESMEIQTEPQRKAAQGQYRAFETKLLPKWLNTGTPICIGPENVSSWLQTLDGDAGESEDMEVDDITEDERPKRMVIFTMGLPPGGGKSSLFESLLQLFSEACNNVSFCYRSSDDFKGRQPFEKSFLACVEGRKEKQSAKGNPNTDAKIVAVGYDKNIPNMEGLFRLLSLLKPLSKRFNLRLLAVVPKDLDHDSFWERVLQRDPKTHIGLAIGPKLSKDQAYKIFKGIFFDPSEEFLALASSAPGAITTDDFTRKVRGGEKLLCSLVEKILPEAVEFKAGASFKQIQLWYDENEQGASFEGKEEGTSQKASPERANWCCADVEGHRDLHVTLVPPPNTKGDRSSAVRKSAMEKLRTVAGRPVTIIASKYHIARMKETKKEEKHIGFWEVDQIDGLPEGLDLGEQGEILHITDRASMSKGVRPKHAAEAMRVLMRATKGAITAWKIETEEHPLRVAAYINFYK